MQPILEENSKANQKLLIELDGKKKVADETAAVCQKEASEAQVIRDEVSE